MRNKLLFFLIVVLLPASVGAAGQEVFGPRLVVKELRHDLGKVKQGTRASHVFELKNEGTDTLEIKQVQPG